MKTVISVTVTSASLLLLIDLVKDAPNWNGVPMIDISAAQRGNLTQLKKAGLLKTSRDEGIEWAKFSEGTFEVTDGSAVLKYESINRGFGDRLVTVL